MKACSFLPAATRMIYDMGLQHLLQGVTFECSGEAADKPKVVRCLLEGKKYNSAEIDKIFSASKVQGKSLYYVDEELLRELEPDIIFTQDVCEVCQIDSTCTAAAVAKLEKQPLVISLTPNNLDDVFQTALTIAVSLGRKEAAYEYLAALQKRTDLIQDKIRENNMPLLRVMLIEWIDPIYNCGHWIPFQIANAGGIDLLANPAGDSTVTSWGKIMEYNPEVLIVAPCGFTTKRSLEEMPLLSQNQAWTDLEAVQQNRVYVLDYDLFTQPSAGTLVDGIELLAALFFPQFFKVPTHLQNKYVRSPIQKQPGYVQA
jgi:iron complex transport system substrate-binding protein